MNTVLEDTARYYMWCRLIPEYSELSSRAKKHHKIAYAIADSGWLPQDYTPSAEDYIKASEYPFNPLTGKPINMDACCNNYTIYDDLTITSIGLAPLPPAKAPCKPAKMKSKKMYDDFETPIQTRTDETKKRDYLTDRLDSAECKKRDDLYAMFNMNVRVNPKSKDEITAALKNFQFRDEYFDTNGKMTTYARWNDTIQLIDPAKPTDEKGYNAACKAMRDEIKKAADAIMILDPATDGLKALQAFEAWTPTTATATAQ